jgi:hypothetical protein
MKTLLNILAVAVLLSGMVVSTQSFAATGAASHQSTVVAHHAAAANEIQMADPEDYVEPEFTGSDSNG